eukprot:6214601-Pleurochrysis_carterae.AAC.1
MRASSLNTPLPRYLSGSRSLKRRTERAACACHSDFAPKLHPPCCTKTPPAARAPVTGRHQLLNRASCVIRTAPRARARMRARPPAFASAQVPDFLAGLRESSGPMQQRLSRTAIDMAKRPSQG